MGDRSVDLILKGEYLLAMTDAEAPVLDAAVAVKDGVIIDIGPAEDIVGKYEARELLGGQKKVIIPGLVNTHTHAAMVYFRGLADDLPLKQWLEEHIWPAEAKWLSNEFVRDATELACLEMVRAGVTLYNDMYFFEDASAEAVKKVGMRAVLGAGVLDFPTPAASTPDEHLERAEEFIKRWKDDPLVVPSIAPHAPYTCSPETYKRCIELAEKYDVPVHTHLSETRWEVEEIKKRYGKSPVEHLNSYDLLTDRMLAAHCVWLDEKEIELMAEKGVSVSHCIESNLKLASGIAPVVKMLKAGVKVTFGTDGAASNNDLNILSEMSTAAKLHKAVSGDPTALSARVALLMATRWGAEALGLGDVTGSIEVGKSADMVILDLEKIHLVPIYDIYSHIAYSLNSSDVHTVVINGEVILKDYKFVRVDAEEVMKNALKWQERIKNN